MPLTGVPDLDDAAELFDEGAASMGEGDLLLLESAIYICGSSCCWPSIAGVVFVFACTSARGAWMLLVFGVPRETGPPVTPAEAAEIDEAALSPPARLFGVECALVLPSCASVDPVCLLVDVAGASSENAAKAGSESDSEGGDDERTWVI